MSERTQTSFLRGPGRDNTGDIEIMFVQSCSFRSTRRGPFEWFTTLYSLDVLKCSSGKASRSLLNRSSLGIELAIELRKCWCRWSLLADEKLDSRSFPSGQKQSEKQSDLHELETAAPNRWSRSSLGTLAVGRLSSCYLVDEARNCVAKTTRQRIVRSAGRIVAEFGLSPPKWAIGDRKRQTLAMSRNRNSKICPRQRRRERSIESCGGRESDSASRFG